MKYSLLFCLIFLVGLSPGVAKEKHSSCWDTAMTQYQLDECAGSELKVAEDAMDKVYRQIQKENAADKLFLRRLEEAQQAWMVFRDAEMKALFPHAVEPGQYGSVYPMCYANWMAELTRERTRQLKKWTIGVEESDVCSGSLPIRQDDEK